MHYALPPRKNDKPHPYAAKRTTDSRWFRRGRGPNAAYIVLALFLLFIFVSRFRRIGSNDYVPSGTPRAIIVTAFDASFRGKYERMITENRKMYAHMHGKIQYDS